MMHIFKFRDDFAGYRSLNAGGDLHPDDPRCASAEDGEEFVRLSDHESELDALREELAKLKAQLETWNHLDLQRDARLTAAEQRNAEGSAAIQLACTFLNRSLANLNPSRQLFKDIREFLKDNDKPTESGASE